MTQANDSVMTRTRVTYLAAHEPGFGDVLLVVGDGDTITDAQHTQQVQVAIVLQSDIKHDTSYVMASKR